MNFFGIGPMELILILVVALIVFGPGKMPEIGRSVGSAIREFRRASQELTSELTREMDMAQLKELRDEARALRAEIKQAATYSALGVMAEQRSGDAEEEEARAELAQPGPVELAQERVRDEELAGEEVAREQPATAVTTPATRSALQKRIARRAAASRRDRGPRDTGPYD